MADAQRVISIIFAGTDELSDKIKTITKSFDDSAKSIDKFADPISGATQQLLALETAVVAAGAALGVFAISQAIKFQDSSTALDQVLGETTRTIESFGDSALDLSNKFGTAATDVQDSFAAFSSAGFAADQVEGLTESVLKFASASNTDATVATDSLVRILKGFNAEASESPAILDMITANTDKYATNVDQMSEALARSSAIGKSSNLTIAETIGVLTPMVEVFQSAEIASTAFNAVMQRLTSDNKNVTDALKELNVSQTDSNGKMKGAKDILLDVQKAYVTLDSSQKPVITNLIAGAEQAAKFAFVFDGLNKTAEATAQALAGVGTAVDERLRKRMDDASFALKLVATQFQNAAIVAGGPFLAGINDLATGLSDLALVLQDLAKSDQFKSFADAIVKQLEIAGASFTQFSKALPEALKQVDFSDFLEQLGFLKDSFGDLFSGVDLTTPEGLAEVFQLLVDVGTNVIAFNRGLVEALDPVIKAFHLLTSAVVALPSELSALVGIVGGATLAWTALAPAISLASTTLGGFGKLIGAGGDFLRGVDKASAATTILGGNMLTLAKQIPVAAAAGYAFGTGINFVIDKITQSTTEFNSLGDAMYFLVNGASPKLMTSTEALAASMAAQTKATKDAGIAWDVYGGGIDAITGKFAPFSQAAKDFTDTLNQQQGVTNSTTSEYQKLTSELARVAAAYGEVLDTLDPFAAKISEQGQAWKSAAEKVDLAKEGFFEIDGVWTQLTASGTDLASTTETVGDKQEGAAEKAAKLAMESEKLDLEWAKLASQERQLVFEATANLHIAEVEAQATQFAAIMESLNTAIESTGEGILGLAKLFVESQNKFGVGSEIAALLRKEEERRKKAFEQQEQLIKAQLKYLDVSTQKLQSGDALITINADGIEEELRAVLFKVVELAHIEASSSAGPLLLGLPQI